MNQTTRFSTPAGGVPAAEVPRRRIAIIAASWHRDIVEAGTDALHAELARRGIPHDCIDTFDVPGAFEIPLRAKQIAALGHHDAIIACALVVNGGIYRHEFVASAVIDGLMRVQLDMDVPVFSMVLTPRDFHEHEEHLRFFREHFVKKGAEAADACFRTLDGIASLRSGVIAAPARLKTASVG